MNKTVGIIGGGLAGSEAALRLSRAGFKVILWEMRPTAQTPVHHTSDFAELVCSNSLKGKRADSAAGMLKRELDILGSALYSVALECEVPAGGSLAVNRTDFSSKVTSLIDNDESIEVRREEVSSLEDALSDVDALVLATGPLTSDDLARSISDLLGQGYLAFYDAAAPIIMADSIDMDIAFKQDRYDDPSDDADYLNLPLSADDYKRFIDELIHANRVISKDFETRDLFSACQPIEEVAKSGEDAPRYGAMKPVGLRDPRTGERPWAVVQLRAEDKDAQSYNIVGFQTNLTFPEQKRVFSMIPGLESADFARYGVMHRNTFLDAPRCIDRFGKLLCSDSGADKPIYVAGQLAGTEGYCEAIRSGLHVALALEAELKGSERIELPDECAFGSLMRYATSPDTTDYQPMHVNFGIIKPLAKKVKNKRMRYAEYAKRGEEHLMLYAEKLKKNGQGAF